MVPVAWGMFLAYCLYQAFTESPVLAVVVAIGGVIGGIVAMVRYTVKHGGGHATD